MSVYLYYDVKGIQSFIFKIPKLKYIVGGSALIDEFDKDTVPQLAQPEPTEAGTITKIFTGGGRGAFFCDSPKTATRLKRRIIRAAHKIGLDISFGIAPDFSLALLGADELYPFVPDLPKNSAPCPESGLYPVALTLLEKMEQNRDVPCHPVVKQRRFKSGTKTFRRFENMLLKGLNLPIPLDSTLEFFHNVNRDDQPQGEAGARALGGRNRWAVICMDGNDMGRQFRQLLRESQSNAPLPETIRKMSSTLAKITARAALKGVQLVVTQWAGKEGKKEVVKGGTITLPIRPLLVGGDDIVVLCRCNYAAAFVKEVSQVFEEESQKFSWPATDNGLTISAGILYTAVTLPLHTAIPYAEALLESAKEKGRQLAKERKAPPACIDWEQITESVIDTPEAKRQRELAFFDPEIEKEIRLTRRPYTLVAFSKAQAQADRLATGRHKLPRTVRHQILQALSQGRQDRLAFAAQVKKHHPELFDMLNERDSKGKKDFGWQEDPEGTIKTMGLPDLLLLIEEADRIEEAVEYE